MDTIAFGKINKALVRFLDKNVEYKGFGYPVGHDSFTGLYFFKTTENGGNVKSYDSNTVIQAILKEEFGLE